jgi:serine/threonine protein kinase
MMDFFYPRDQNQYDSLDRVPSSTTELSSSISPKVANSLAPLDHYDYTLATRYGSRKMLNSTFFRGKRRGVLNLADYAIKKTVGVGSFAKVKLCINLKTSEKVAVKIIEKSNFKSQKLKTAIKREIKLNKLVYHPHIVQVLEMIETDANIFIMMEYVDGGDLFSYITQVTHLTEKEARYLFRQVISAIDYLHKVI